MADLAYDNVIPGLPDLFADTRWMANFILWTDSYKFTHWMDLEDDTDQVWSYFEARKGATYDTTLWFGVQSMLKMIEGQVVTQAMVEQASLLAEAHFGRADIFNREGWERIVNEFDGRLPLELWAVDEGTRVPVDNMLMSVTNTEAGFGWLVGALESFVTHVWYPMTVATKSRAVKDLLIEFLTKNGTPEAVDLMLQDFGFRGATNNEAAALGGAGHLVNFMGTDTLLAMALVMDDYAAELTALAYSVVATEHSIMTQLGRDGEYSIIEKLLKDHSEGILSVVADSYDIYRHVRWLATDFRDQILAREMPFVTRPDSITSTHPTPELLVLAILDILAEGFDVTINDKGYKVLPPQIRVLWGDGIDIDGIRKILTMMDEQGWSTDNIACFGMGGGLLQKVNRDTQRCAFKAAAHFRNGEWFDIHKDPLDSTKRSKAGRQKLILVPGRGYKTVRVDDGTWKNYEDQLKLRFKNGVLYNTTTFAEVRERSNA